MKVNRVYFQEGFLQPAAEERFHCGTLLLLQLPQTYDTPDVYDERQGSLLRDELERTLRTRMLIHQSYVEAF